MRIGILSVELMFICGHLVGAHGDEGAGSLTCEDALHDFGFASEHEYAEFYPDKFIPTSYTSDKYFDDILKRPRSDLSLENDSYCLYHFDTEYVVNLTEVMGYLERKSECGYLFPLISVPTVAESVESTRNIKNLKSVSFWFCSDWKG